MKLNFAFFSESLIYTEGTLERVMPTDVDRTMLHVWDNTERMWVLKILAIINQAVSFSSHKY